MTRRFYVERIPADHGAVTLAGALAQRIAKVLRLRAGDDVVLFDGDGEDARVRLDRVAASGVSGRVVERVAGPPEPHVKVHLYQSITKGERFAWLLEKGTEIGVARFVPLIAARAVVRPGAEGQKAERWRRIVVEAAEQCGRSAVPAVEAPQRFDEALASAPGVLVLPYESADEGERNMQAALHGEIDALFALGAVSIFIGPEGGFEPAEVERAKDAGASIVTLGRRVLRSETAGLVAATLALHATGDLG